MRREQRHLFRLRSTAPVGKRLTAIARERSLPAPLLSPRLPPASGPPSPGWESWGPSDFQYLAASGEQRSELAPVFTCAHPLKQHWTEIRDELDVLGLRKGGRLSSPIAKICSVLPRQRRIVGPAAPTKPENGQPAPLPPLRPRAWRYISPCRGAKSLRASWKPVPAIRATSSP
jgi:hypothetical protein